MPSHWSPLPRFGNHPPQPASSTYSPPPGARSAALRPGSGLFDRFASTFGRQSDVPPVPPVPQRHTQWPGPQEYDAHNVFEAGPGQRSDYASDTNPVPMPRPLWLNPSPRAALQPANNAAGDLPNPFSTSEADVHDASNHATGDSSAPEPNIRGRSGRHQRSHRHGHRRHQNHGRRASEKSTSSSLLHKTRSPWRDPDVRVKLLHVFISGLLFGITLIIFLALSPTTPVFAPQFRIVNSLLIVFFAIIFVHSVVRLTQLVSAARRRQKRLARKNREADGIASPGGSRDFGRNGVPGVGGQPSNPHLQGVGRAPYFDDPEIGLPPPGEPFRVVLASDDDLGVNDDLVRPDDHLPTGAGGAPHDSLTAAEAQHPGHSPHIGVGGLSPRPMAPRSPVPDGRPMMPPPVYGVWRGSVRADPNLLHWQRVDGPGSDAGGAGSFGRSEDAGSGTLAGRPPPSYATQERRPAAAPADEVGLGAGGLEFLPATRYVI